MAALKHVRPGNGFEFKGEMFDKVKTGIRDQLPLLLSCLLRWRLMETMNIQSSNFSRSLSPNLLMTLKAWWPTLSSSSGDPSRGLTLHGTLKSSSSVLMELLWKDIPGMYRFWEVKWVFIYNFFQKLSDLRYSCRYLQSYLRKKWWNSWDGRWIVYWRKKWCKVWKYFTNYVESESFCILFHLQLSINSKTDI